MSATWTGDSTLLLLGTSKGHVVMYNESDKRRSVTMGKAAKRISHLACSGKGHLAVASDDMHVSIARV